jgi:hypothetical protein
MSPDEIWTRATMTIRQRLDLWEAQRGKNPLQPRYSGQAGIVPRFFFDAGDAAIVAAENVPGVKQVLDNLSDARAYPPPEEDLGGGDFVSLQEQPSTIDDEPL